MSLVSRRRLLGLASLGTLGAAIASPIRAQPAEPIHVQLGQVRGQFLQVPPATVWPVRWPSTYDEFPDPRGLVSPDRTEIHLADPGVYLLTATLTFEPGPGHMRKFSFRAATAEGGWHTLGDGNEAVAGHGHGQETTLVGIAWARSDGSLRVCLAASHDSPRPLAISDRSYECHFSAAFWQP